jgi:hypothetical protein
MQLSLRHCSKAEADYKVKIRYLEVVLCLLQNLRSLILIKKGKIKNSKYTYYGLNMKCLLQPYV